MKLLLTNIKELLQIREQDTKKIAGGAMKELPSLKNAWLLLEDNTIKDFGTMDSLADISAEKTIDCTGKMVLPTWCDSHTHIVYAGNREQEFVDRINGLSYQEIAEKGGGILNSAKKLQETHEEDLYKQSAQRLEQVMRMGTGAIEIKSGYGLTTEAELKMLRVAKKLGDNFPVTVKTTFLGAHAVPAEFKGDKDGYLNHIITNMLPKVAQENLADYIDIFCEKGYFSVEDTHKLLQAGNSYGLMPKIHVNQFNAIGGVKAGVVHDALSVDHLEVLTNADISVLQNSDTMPVALPSCSYFLSIPYTPGRELIDAGLPLALATDYNPGSTPSGNMNFVVATACIKMKLTPEEAINAATLNGAYAMGLSDTHGSITKGKNASVMVTKEIPSYAYLPYDFGNNNIETVIINGKTIE
ncbi:imidazolonepropionase [Marinirhabdus gelatinilytica]|uniref:Imidazolonepropionase n=1 Tax=Marinirhabdus gelatinilytica TaxID=1703343 RepID=A0A370QGC4_9FLAO|nr:imidazolonepropionase [Marinirhabdus gelatinilytica]RDK87100.1 imidazolonepropionase [Marinirhabdus gelatinilytica]